MRYLSFENQIQTLVVQRKVNQVEVLEGAYQDDETRVTQTPYYVKCPWQFRFSLEGLYDIKLIFGAGNDDALKVYQNHPVAHANAKLDDDAIGLPNSIRLFYKTTRNDSPSIHPSDNNLADDYTTSVGDVVTYNMLTNLDMSDYSVSYSVDMNIEANKERLRSLPIVDQHDFVANVMNRARFAFPGKTTFLQQQEMICVKFVPASRTYNGYEGYNNGLHLQFNGEGPKLIEQRGLSDEEYLVFAGATTLTDGTVINKGQPYKLRSQSIEVSEGTNMILHIWRS